jgi:hypothetical protein
MPPSKMPAKAQAALAEQRKHYVMQLRLQGLAPTEIAEKLHVNVNTVHADLRHAVLSVQQRATLETEQLREIELMRLDKLQQPYWTRALKGDVDALDRVLKIMERRAKMLGLDAPARHAVVHTDIDQWRNSEEWQNTVNAILEAVNPYPQAASAIYNAIEKLRMASDIMHGTVVDAEVIEIEAAPEPDEPEVESEADGDG